MSAKLGNPKVLAGVVFAAVALVVAGAWILLVSPERSKVGTLDGQITSVQTQIDQRRAGAGSPVRAQSRWIGRWRSAWLVYHQGSNRRFRL